MSSRASIRQRRLMTWSCSITSEEMMDIKPALVVDKCKRVGKKTPGKVQSLLIVMANVDTAQQIIRDSRHLRDFTKWKITYINPDLTPSQSRAA